MKPLQIITPYLVFFTGPAMVFSLATQNEVGLLVSLCAFMSAIVVLVVS